MMIANSQYQLMSINFKLIILTKILIITSFYQRASHRHCMMNTKSWTLLI